jgi:hypothetical protein
MPIPIDQAKTTQALGLLGVSASDFEAMRRVPFAQAQEMLRVVKERVRKNFRRLVLELHPDRTGNDPEKTEQFKVLAQIFADFNKLEVRPPAPMPPVSRQTPVTWVQYVRTRQVNTATNVNPNATHVVFLRPL